MKKIHILRLISVVPNGVGGAGAGCIDLIYSFLLQEYKMDFYSYIHVNQIGKDLNELIIREGKKIHININYPAREDFEELTSLERNKIRLDIVHKALLRIADYDEKLDVFALEPIRQRILDQNFSFYFLYRTYINKKDPNFQGTMIIHPEETCFEFYCHVKKAEKDICQLLIYKGVPVALYFRDFFSNGKWKSDKLIISGKEDKIEIQVLYEQCKVEYVSRFTFPHSKILVSCQEFNKIFVSFENKLL